LLQDVTLNFCSLSLKNNKSLLKIQQKSIEKDEKNLEKSENINFNRKKWRFHKTNSGKSRK
jgi:hypothetical protein